MNVRDLENAIIEEIRDSRAVRAELHDIVDDVAEEWRRQAPVDSGEYRASITVRKSSGRIDLKGRTPAATVVAEDEAASFIEYGTEDTPEHAPMRRTLSRFNT